MKSLIMIARLLDYPDQALWDHKQECIDSLSESDALGKSNELDAAQSQRVVEVIEKITAQPTLDAQSQYSELFDRGRSISLLLFEHVHGESRDRGQAMIDLMGQYEEAGLALDANELPDHLPTYLEFLSIQSVDDIKQGLRDVAPILALLAARLENRESLYSDLFRVLLDFSGADTAPESLKETVLQEKPDYTPEALDEIWEDEQVRFLADDSCKNEQQTEHERRFADDVAPQYIDLANPPASSQTAQHTAPTTGGNI